MDVLAILLSLGATAVAIGLALRVRRLEERLASLTFPVVAPSLIAPEENVLQGLRIGVDVQQDHAHPVFAELLRDTLLGRDVADVILGRNDACDCVLDGRVTCHGYSDVYFEADLTCTAPSGVLCTLIEKPPSGDRQENLALEIVSRLTKELEKSERRGERRAALKELGRE